MRDDNGWIRTLLEEAENERMHLMTFIEVAQPTCSSGGDPAGPGRVLHRLLRALPARHAPRTAMVGYFEEEAVISYTLYLAGDRRGPLAELPAPAIASHYWNSADATLRDVVLVVRADEAHHRDVNHGFASELAHEPPDASPVAPYPPRAKVTPALG